MPAVIQLALGPCAGARGGACVAGRARQRRGRGEENGCDALEDGIMRN